MGIAYVLTLSLSLSLFFSIRTFPRAFTSAMCENLVAKSWEGTYDPDRVVNLADSACGTRCANFPKCDGKYKYTHGRREVRRPALIHL